MASQKMMVHFVKSLEKLKNCFSNIEQCGLLEGMHSMGKENCDACLLSAGLHGNHKTETSHV